MTIQGPPPVAAVTCAGRPTVSSGSRIATFGMIAGWKMIFFTWVAELVMTLARPTSEPVPAVHSATSWGKRALWEGKRARTDKEDPAAARSRGDCFN